MELLTSIHWWFQVECWYPSPSSLLPREKGKDMTQSTDKSNVTTQNRHQKLRLHKFNDCGTTKDGQLE